MWRNNLMITALLLLFTKLLSQSDNKNTYPNNEMLLSPDVSAFQRYNLTDVNLYTGKIDLSIPLYEIKTGNITVPISISYNSSGVKVDNIASSVGMGWNLNAGGNIIRKIKDLDDHSILSQSGQSNSKPYIYELGWLRQMTDISPDGTLGSGLITTYSKTDASPDVFKAVAPGLNANFYLTNLNRGNPNNFYNNVSTYNLKFLDGSGTKGDIVTKKLLSTLPASGFSGGEVLSTFFPPNVGSGGVPNDYEKFQLTNTEGVKYSFDSPDVVESIPSFASAVNRSIMSFSSASFYNSYMQAMAGGQYRLRVSAWHLGKIEDSNTNRTVEFKYQKYAKPEKNYIRTNINTVLLEDAMPFGGGSYNYPSHGICAYGFIADYMTSYPYSSPPDECLVKNAFLYTKAPQNNRIEEIKWDNGEVKFYYDLTRQDAQNEKALTKVEVRLNNKIIKTYLFNYSYFISKENCNDWQCKRLKLDNIDVLGSEEIQPKRYYTFEYDYTNPLPRVNSLQQDYLGFYNNHGVELEPINMHIHPQIQKSPKLYFRSQRGKYSITPFSGSKLIPGDYSLDANNYALTGLLKKVINPLGGFNEYEYELNDFYIDSEIYQRTGGGARIKTQIINDGNKERHIYYEYKEKNGVSSGRLAGMPIYGYPLAYDQARYADQNNVSFVVYTTNRENVELTSNGYVGYTRVVEKEEGNGYKEHIFSFEEDQQNTVLPSSPSGNYCYAFLYQNSSFHNSNSISNEIVRGKKLEENYYNQNGNLVKEIKNNYAKNILEEISVPYQNTIFQPRGIVNYDPGFNNVSFLARHNYITKVRTERNVLTERTEKLFFQEGNVETKSILTYDSVFPFIKKQRNLNPDNSFVDTDFLYPHDLANQMMINANMLDKPLVTETVLTKNGIAKTIAKKESVFNKNVNTSNLILPVSAVNYKRDNSQETEISYDKYDNKGNLLQSTSKMGISNVTIWGYKQTLPIIKIEGATYEQVMQKFNLNSNDNQAYLNLDAVLKSDADISPSTEQDLVNSLVNFRNTMDLPGNQIILYTHDPGRGITNILQPNGLKQAYKYNAEDKLEKISNDQNKTIKEFSYNSVPNHPQTIFYNRKQEKVLVRNNCPVGYSGGNYPYVVPAAKYSSTISLADANQQALNDILQIGQGLANTNAACTSMTCPFTPESNVNSVISSIHRTSNTNVVVNIKIPVVSNTGLNWQSFVAGTIGESCKLLTLQNHVFATENGRTWRVLMSWNGKILLQLMNGSIGASDTVNLNFQYDINDFNML
ncbi:DUF5977 domain-containing protein [Chryseobacterium vrystaatense]|uniref:DUF5977 domain-containing protein n=1 Tax=Chryseobacterium vrystaatense TaxID=307480 RepID=A0A1M5DTV6_9FLAO|nr:DUF5977 domain-containing protein [Chryseobacterium vrystaatense]SHF70355.1 hypothetical protein SAMN02787073_2713 [Chryseobacterium vrystaatense]